MEKGFKTTAKRDLEQGLACRWHGRIRLGKLLALRHRRFDTAVLQGTTTVQPWTTTAILARAPVSR
jgi:hypothetical protein